MSKPNSFLFNKTLGAKISQYTRISVSIDTNPSESDIIASRVKGFDLHEHPYKYKQLSRKKMAALRKKKEKRTMTKKEYKIYNSNKRLASRRDKAKIEFWHQEKLRIQNNMPTTRKWSSQQMHDIIHNKIPKNNGKAFQAHHTYSVSKYPHLADKGEVIFPATFKEHLYGWHGGNFKNSLPGKPINKKNIKQYKEAQ